MGKNLKDGAEHPLAPGRIGLTETQFDIEAIFNRLQFLKVIDIR